VLLAVDRSKFEPQAAQPEREDIAQSLTRDRVVPLAANRGDRDQSGVEKDSEVPGRRRPGVREAGAELAGASWVGRLMWNEDGANTVLIVRNRGRTAMTDTQPTQPSQQPPPESSQPTAPTSTGSELFVSWLLIVTFILFPLVGLIWVIVDAPRLGYRRHDALFALIPIYGPFVFLPKMAWRIGHKERPYWQNWPAR
jgi:hypothetical protein